MYYYTREGLNAAVHSYYNYLNNEHAYPIKLSRAREAFAAMHNFKSFSSFCANPTFTANSGINSSKLFTEHCGKKGFMHDFGYPAIPELRYSPIAFDDFFPTHIILDKHHCLYLTIQPGQQGVDIRARLISAQPGYLHGFIRGHYLLTQTNTKTIKQNVSDGKELQRAIDEISSLSTNEAMSKVARATIKATASKALDLIELGIDGVSNNEDAIEQALNVDFIEREENVRQQPTRLDIISGFKETTGNKLSIEQIIEACRLNSADDDYMTHRPKAAISYIFKAFSDKDNLASIETLQYVSHYDYLESLCSPELLSKSQRNAITTLARSLPNVNNSLHPALVSTSALEHLSFMVGALHKAATQ